MSAHQKHWHVRNPAPPELAARLGCSPVIATLLYQRDLCELDIVSEFLHAEYPNGLHDPFLMKGMNEASERIAAAITNGEPMAVYGDFDTDGVTAVALLQQAITAMGGVIQPYIPHRTREGYGLNTAAVEQLGASGVRLLITVDCGIGNVAEVARAQALGLDVIVTDHHHPPATLPDALAVVNPKQPGCNYPYKQLVGVGVAYKLVQALFKRGFRLQGLRGRDLLDVVALGTVTDMGPLNGENRILVKAGLKAINTTERPGLKALIEVAGLALGHVDATAIGFMLGPRINAAGRLDDAARAYDLLLADNYAAAQRLAQELNQANRQRQELTKQVQAAARAQAEATGKDQQRIVILDGADYPAGIVGLVAGKLVEEWARPVLLIERGAHESRGSARSIPGFNIIEALTDCKDLFVRFGGHSMAAGFTIANENIPHLEQRLQDGAHIYLHDDMLKPTLYIDAMVALEDVNQSFYTELAQLEPFGQANPQPTLMTRNVQITGAWPKGNEGQHLKLSIAPKGGRSIEAMAFRLGRLAEPLRRHPSIDIAYTLSERVWNGERSLQLIIKDLRRAQ
jgi:single-stranded-DNA-specific exonuclease